MTIKTTSSVEMRVDAGSTVEELLDAFCQNATPESAKITIVVQKADTTV